jgi:hypothetical protein
MKLLNSLQKQKPLVFILFISMFTLMAYACGSSGGGGGDSSAGTGSIAFAVALENPRARFVASQADSGFECKTEEYEITTLNTQVLDENDEPLIDEEITDCNAHETTIEEVAAGDQRKVVLSAKDESNNTIFEGTSDPVNVRAGQTVDAGLITLTPVNQPPVLDPIGPKSVNAGELLSFIVTATDPDPDDDLTFSASNLPAGAGFIASEQQFNWTPVAGDVGTHKDYGESQSPKDTCRQSVCQHRRLRR